MNFRLYEYCFKKISFSQCASTSSTPDCFDVIRGINLWNVETWIMNTFQGVHSTKPHIIFNASKLLNYCSPKKCMEISKLCDILPNDRYTKNFTRWNFSHFRLSVPQCVCLVHLSLLMRFWFFHSLTFVYFVSPSMTCSTLNAPVFWLGS